jgi:hypothetical protein
MQKIACDPQIRFTEPHPETNENGMRCLIPLLACSSLVLAREDDSELPFDRFFDDENRWNFHEHADYESRYALEGRDALDGDSLVSTTFEVGWNALSAGVWYGKSPDQSYDELQLSTALSWDWKDLEGYVAYTHLRFPQDGGHDHEIGAGVSWSGLPGEVELGVEAYYSFDADGTFIVTSLSREFELSDRLQLTPAIVFGVNQGYVTDGHDGANHIELRLGGTYALTDALALTAHLSYNLAIDRDASRFSGDELLRDFLHVGVGLAYEF